MFNGQVNNRFGVKQDVHEAPLAIGALVGGLAGSAGVAGLTLMSGALLGAAAGGLLGGMFKQKTPKVQSSSNQQQQAAAQTPALPPATPMPAAPMTPVAAPEAPGILKPDEAIAPDIPQAERPQEPAEASPPTNEEVARGQLEKKRKGRLSTILTTPASRLLDGESEGNEKLGG
jgi:predicted lipid-binding transport protein (Tim44 family)